MTYIREICVHCDCVECRATVSIPVTAANFSAQIEALRSRVVFCDRCAAKKVLPAGMDPIAIELGRQIGLREAASVMLKAGARGGRLLSAQDEVRSIEVRWENHTLAQTLSEFSVTIDRGVPTLHPPSRA